jgi:hypothetical protein
MQSIRDQEVPNSNLGAPTASSEKTSRFNAPTFRKSADQPRREAWQREPPPPIAVPAFLVLHPSGLDEGEMS